MAIEFTDTAAECPHCSTDLTCLHCDYKGSEFVLPLSRAQRDVLQDILKHTTEQHERGRVKMSATDLNDLLDLVERVEEL